MSIVSVISIQRVVRHNKNLRFRDFLAIIKVAGQHFSMMVYYENARSSHRPCLNELVTIDQIPSEIFRSMVRSTQET